MEIFLIIAEENSWFVECDAQGKLPAAPQRLFIINQLHLPRKVKDGSKSWCKKRLNLRVKPTAPALAMLFRHHPGCALGKGERSLASHMLSALSHHILNHLFGRWWVYLCQKSRFLGDESLQTKGSQGGWVSSGSLGAGAGFVCWRSRRPSSHMTLVSLTTENIHTVFPTIRMLPKRVVRGECFTIHYVMEEFPLCRAVTPKNKRGKKRKERKLEQFLVLQGLWGFLFVFFYKFVIN